MNLTYLKVFCWQGLGNHFLYFYLQSILLDTFAFDVRMARLADLLNKLVNNHIQYLDNARLNGYIVLCSPHS